MRSIRQKLCSFPEMDEAADVPEITTACWSILNKDPKTMMCSSSRMIVKRKGDTTPRVIACTFLPYEPEFNLEKRCKMHPNPFFLITPIAPNSVSWVGQPVPPKEISMLKAGRPSGSMTHLLVLMTKRVWPQRLPSQIPNMKTK